MERTVHFMFHKYKPYTYFFNIYIAGHKTPS